MISPGELAVGMFVTVLDNKPYERQEAGNSVLSESQVIVTVNVDRSGMGNVHTVLAVDLPYVAMRREDSSFVHSYDTRRTTLMELSAEYVKAICPKLGIKTNITKSL